MRKIAVFDLDHTILSTDSFIDYVIFMLTKYPLKLFYLPYLSLLLVLKVIGIIKFEYFKSKWLLFFKGINIDEIENNSKKFCDNLIRKNVKKGALDEIERLRKSGFELVLATASFEFYVKYIFEYLRFDHLFGTKVLYDDKRRIIPEIDGKNCKALEKISRITSVINKNDIDRINSTGYSDCKSDLFFLEITGTFNLVAKKQWKIIKEYKN